MIACVGRVQTADATKIRGTYFLLLSDNVAKSTFIFGGILSLKALLTVIVNISPRFTDSDNIDPVFVHRYHL